MPDFPTPLASVPPAAELRIYSPGQRAPASPWAMLQVCWANRDLIWQLTRREVLGRYRGSLLGLAWSFFHPLLLLAAYTFAFSYVLKVGRIAGKGAGGGGGEDILDFAFYAFSGLILLGMVAEVASRAPGVILQNATYVKKVVFPLEVLPLVQLGSAAIHATMSLLVLVIAQALLRHHVPVTILLVPVVLLPLALVILGLAWMLSALGVFLRDVGQVIGIVVLMLLYLSPVFYQMSMIDDAWVRGAILANPLTIPLVNFRHVALEGVLPDWPILGLYAGVSALAAWLGFWCFQRFRRGFADVL